MPAEKIGGVQRDLDQRVGRQCSDLKALGVKPLEHLLDLSGSDSVNLGTSCRILTDSSLKVAVSGYRAYRCQSGDTLSVGQSRIWLPWSLNSRYGKRFLLGHPRDHRDDMHPALANDGIGANMTYGYVLVANGNGRNSTLFILNECCR